MNNILRIIIDDNIPRNMCEVEQRVNVDGFATTYYIKSETSFKDLFDDKFVQSGIEDYNVSADMFGKVKIENSSEIFENIEYIQITACNNPYNEMYMGLDYEIGNTLSEEERLGMVKQFLNDNEELKNFKIAVPDYVDINTDIDEIIKSYDGYTILVSPKESEDVMTVETFKSGHLIVDLIDNIKQMNLSPLEKVMLVYDIVREKPYKHEEEGANSSESRDLYYALQGDTIVCAGYATIYSYIMKNLGIQCTEALLDGVEGYAGHARNVIYVNDDKYNIEGIFLVDPTMDTRRENDKYEYLYTYDGFLKKKKDLDASDYYGKTIDRTFNILSDYNVDDLGQFLDPHINTNNLHSPRSFIDQVNIRNAGRRAARILTNLVGDKPIDLTGEDDEKSLIDKYESSKNKIARAWNKEMDLLTFVKLLINVRYIENKIDPDKYPYNLTNIYNNSVYYGYKLNKDQLLNIKPAEEILLEAIFGSSSQQEELSEEEMKEIIKQRYVSELKKAHHIIDNEYKENKLKVVKSIKLYDYKGKTNVKK
jgi:hypothetical protein